MVFYGFLDADVGSVLSIEVKVKCGDEIRLIN